MKPIACIRVAACLLFWGAAIQTPGVETLPGTEPLPWTDDIASRLVEGVDRFLLDELSKSVAARKVFWTGMDFRTPAAYIESLLPLRERLASITGVRDQRPTEPVMELVATTEHPADLGTGSGYHAWRVRWPAWRNVYGEGVLLVPDSPNGIDIVAIPDANDSPEAICGLVPGLSASDQYARRLAESGCRVLVPVLISRQMEVRRSATLTHREYVYRSAFELGRHLIGYEMQKVLAGVDWFVRQAGTAEPRIGVIGYGEGGLVALYSAALDPRIDAVCVSGYFDSRQGIWQEPIDRNIFGLLERYGDAELAAMVAPRPCIIEACRGVVQEFPGKGGAPARLVSPVLDSVQAEVTRAREILAQGSGLDQIQLVVSGDGQGPAGSDEALKTLLAALHETSRLAALGPDPRPITDSAYAARRLARQIDQLDDHNQWLLRESPYVRQEFITNKLDTKSLDGYERSLAPFRKYFRDEVIGTFDQPLLPPNPRTRKAYDESSWTGYEVVLDVFPDVIAYGVLLLPKDIRPGEKRPVVVCQHGLEGRPQHVIQGDEGAYHNFAARLAERGFITFAPQNLYIFTDRFRTLQRKANPLKKTLFSIMVPQHQQIVHWLAGLPQVDPQRIAFYGLSYGGKSAMRIPPLVPEYCLSICSADFNEWVWKNASTRSPYSYVWGGEYEIFEFDLGSTFNYAEMAALIAPRPFMVERGHFDGVAPDETVGYEFAKVRHLYQAQLGIGDRCTIEWFVGPHTINGQETFRFLHRHLRWPER